MSAQSSIAGEIIFSFRLVCSRFDYRSGNNGASGCRKIADEEFAAGRKNGADVRAKRANAAQTSRTNRDGDSIVNRKS